MFSVFVYCFFGKEFCLSVHDVRTILSFLQDPDRLFQPVMNELLSSTNTYSFKYKAFGRLIGGQMKQYRKNTFMAIQRRNTITVMKGMFYETSYLLLLQQEEHDMCMRVTEMACRCEECSDALKKMRLW